MESQVNHLPSQFDPDHPFAVMVERVREYAIFLIDRDGCISSWNPAAAEMKGYEAEEVLGRPLEVLYPDAADGKGAVKHNLDAARRDGTYTEEGWRRKRDGSMFWALVEIISIKDASGAHSGYCKITKDLTLRKNLQDELQREKDRAQVTLNAIGDAVLSVDAQGRIEFLNPTAEQISGWTTDEVRGRDFSELLILGGTPDETQLTVIAQLCQGQVFSEARPAVLKTRNGGHCLIDGVAAPMHTASGEDAGCVIVFRDVTKMREYLAALTHQATHDALTGLVNRAEFDQRLERSIARADGSPTSSALIYIDLDGFKAVNDSAGHLAGDELLRRIAQVLSAQIRERDTLARLGGDEFALLLDGCTRETAATVAEKARRAVTDFRLSYEGRPLQVGASIGITMIAAGDAAADALQRADQACYVAKSDGGNRVHSPRLN